MMKRTGLNLVPNIALCALLSGALGACAVGPDYHARPATDLGVPDTWSVPASTERENLTRWWSRFDDPLLTQVVELAAANNLDLAQAVARLRQAREALKVSQGSLFPTLSGSAGATRYEQVRGSNGAATTSGSSGYVYSGSGGTTNYSVGLDASYQLDLFGGVRRSVEASRDAYQASGYDYATTLLSVESEVAKNYMLARGYQAQLANARDSLKILDENLQIAQWRVQAGLTTSVDVETARSSRAQTAATIPTLEASYNTAVARIGVLTGQAPGTFKALLATPAPIPVTHAAGDPSQAGEDIVGAGVPADTLRQRPDVRSAERSLAAAVARIGVAKAALLPSLSIGGSLTSNATSLSSLLDTITGSLFGTLSHTIFNGGAASAQVRSNRAAADEAFAAYKSAVLSALEDTENAMVALDAAREREVQFAIALDAATNSAVLARSQYRSGLTDFTTLNTAESSLISARDGLAQARSDKAQAIVALYVALGGGWDADRLPDVGNTAVPAGLSATGASAISTSETQAGPAQ